MRKLYFITIGFVLLLNSSALGQIQDMGFSYVPPIPPVLEDESPFRELGDTNNDGSYERYVVTYEGGVREGRLLDVSSGSFLPDVLPSFVSTFFQYFAGFYDFNNDGVDDLIGGDVSAGFDIYTKQSGSWERLILPSLFLDLGDGVLWNVSSGLSRTGDWDNNGSVDVLFSDQNSTLYVLESGQLVV